ncbi:MAG: hypothetical protein ACOH5I_06375 [Oligoflexus sp.]
MTELEARKILRLDPEQNISTHDVEQAFHKMARRYPVEQFPERFSQIRQAFEILSDPLAAVRHVLYDNQLKLSNLIQVPEIKNPLPDTAEQKFLLGALQGTLNYVFHEELTEEDDLPDLGPMTDAELAEMLKALERFF